MSSDRPFQQIPPIFLADVELAQQAAAEYQQSGDPTPLQTAIAAWANILRHPNFATADATFQFAAYHDAAGAYFNHFGATNRLDDLHQAIAHLQQALTLAGDDADARARCLSNLGGLLSQRYAHTGDEADLAAAIQAAEAAVQQTPPDSPDRAARLSNLGQGLSTRYSHTGNPDDLEQAIAVYLEALQQTPPDSPQMASRCNNLASVLQDRYHYSGDTTALDAALQAFEMAVNLTPPQSPDLPLYLNNLGNALRTAYMNTGQLDSLDRAIHYAEQATAQSPKTSFDRAGYLNNLGNALRNRYEATGELTDLNRAVQTYEEAVEMTTAGSVYRPMFLHNLAVGLRNRYFQAGSPEDLERAINYFEAAVQQSPTGSPELPGYLSTLGTALDDRYSQTGSLEDLDRAIATHRQAVAQTPTDAANLPIHLNNLGNALRNRHTRTRQFQDLEAGIANYQQAVDRTPTDSIYRASRLNNLANAWRDRYTHTHQLTDLEQAIQAYEAAIAVVPAEFTERAPLYNNLGNARRDRFHHSRDLNTLNEAVAAYERGLQLTPAQSPEYPSRQNNLAAALKQRFGITGDETDRATARTLFLQAITQGLEMAPEAALLAARSWGDWATERAAWEEAVMAYRYGLQGIEQLFRAQVLRQSKETWLRESQGMAAQAAYALAQVGDLARAVEALEQGLARLLSEVLERDRADLDQLRALGYGERCDRYQAATAQWHRLAQRPLEAPDSERLGETTNFSAVRADLDEAIAEIRQVPGYGNFLKPLTLEAISAAAQAGPVVYIAVTDIGGLALSLKPEGTVAPLWLPALTASSLRQQLVGHDEASAATSYLGAYDQWRQNQQDDSCRDRWFTALDTTTRWLWTVLMGPLVAALAPADRATLIPVGVLGLLPLHAAWVEDATQPTGRCYGLDRLMLTYAPNARGLIAAQAIAARQLPETLLAIADPQPVKAAPLDYAESEVAVAASVLPRHQVLSHGDATRDRVQAVLPDYTVLHCCCHGYVNWAEPLASGLMMAGDEVLSLGDVLELRLTGARLAVLSACETGVAGVALPDEVVSLPTGLLQAGFAGVAASLWSVEDVSTTMLMVRFYQLWRVAGWEPGAALRGAQRWLRDTTNGEKAAYFKGLLSGGAEVGVDVGTVDRLYKAVVLAEPGERSFDHPFRWAAFHYVGV